MKLLLLMTSSLVAAGLSAPAFAQTSNSAALEEVVVTAQRREESIQRAPLAVTALAGADLERQNASSMEGLSTVLPNTQIQPNLGGRVQIQVRGIRTNDFTSGAELPVAVHIDGAYISRPSALGGFFYDLARVEALPGPQGTLYGRNAAAGAINIITNHPTQDFGGYLQLEGGNYNMIRLQGALNVPVNDELALRVAFQSLRHDGYYTTGLEDADQQSVRPSLLWKHGRASLYLQAHLTKIGGHGPGDNRIVAPDIWDNTAIYPADAVSQAHLNTLDFGYTGQFDYDLDFATFTALGSYGNLREEPLFLEGNSAPSATTRAGSFAYYLNKSHDYTFEARLTSKSSTPLSWVVGFFTFGEQALQYRTNFFTLNIGPGAQSQLTYAPNAHVKSYAGFGQATWTPIDPLHLTLGLRYSWDQKTWPGNLQCNTYTASSGACVGGLIRRDTQTPGEWDSWDYRAGVGYDLTPTTLLFASVATGYRAGSWFLSPIETYDPEHVKSYEAGIKNRLFDGRVILNANAYFTDYDNFVQVYVPTFGGRQAENVGKVQIKGVAVNLAWLITPDDRLNASVEYNKTEFVEFHVRLPTTALLPKAGDSLLNSPLWKYYVNYAHTFHVMGGTLTPWAQVAYEDERVVVAGTNQAPATTLDAELSYEPESGRWSVGVFGENLTDEVIISQTSPNAGNALLADRMAHYRPPRTYGVRLKANF